MGTAVTKKTTALEWSGPIQMGKGCIRWEYGPQGGGRKKSDFARVDYDPKKGTTDGKRKYLAEVSHGPGGGGGYYKTGAEAQAAVEDIYASHAAPSRGARKAQASNGTHTTYAADGTRTVIERKPAAAPKKKPKSERKPPASQRDVAARRFFHGGPVEAPFKTAAEVMDHLHPSGIHRRDVAFDDGEGIAVLEAQLREKLAAVLVLAQAAWTPKPLEAASVDPMPDEVAREIRTLTTKLHAEDVDDCVRELAEVVTKTGAISALTSLVRDGLRPLAKVLERRKAELVSLVQRRERTEQVQCAICWSPGRELVDVLRVDDGSHVESRPPTAQERQQSLIP